MAKNTFNISISWIMNNSTVKKIKDYLIFLNKKLTCASLDINLTFVNRLLANKEATHIKSLDPF